MSRDELCVHIARHKLRVRGQIHEEVDIGGQPGYIVLGQACAQLTQCRVPVRTPDRQLGNHRVVVHRHLFKAKVAIKYLLYYGTI